MQLTAHTQHGPYEWAVVMLNGWDLAGNCLLGQSCWSIKPHPKIYSKEGN